MALYIRLQHSVTLIGVTPMPLLERLILHAESQQAYSLHPFVASYIMHTKGPPTCRGVLFYLIEVFWGEGRGSSIDITYITLLDVVFAVLNPSKY